MFDPGSVSAFQFVDWHYDDETTTASLRYRFDTGQEFVEQIVFHGAARVSDPAAREALNSCLQQLFLICGLSYYKAAVPPKIETAIPLTQDAARFFDETYSKGLAEFAFENSLELDDRIRFPSDVSAATETSSLPLARRTAVPIGGGKDSIVALELLARGQEPVVTIGIGNYRPIADVVAVAQRRYPPIEHISIERRISPELLQLNQVGALNGHVPISAIYAFILATAAVLYGFDRIAVANERSANVGSKVADDRFVNHQYSKSLDAETAIAAHIRTNMVENLHYFSVLRPLSELAIARSFARLDEYHPWFVSCNTAFRLRNQGSRWCCNCPKCRFVFLALAPFLSRDRLTAIFGSDLLSDNAQLPGYLALLEVDSPKPFECVGEVEESVAAFALLDRTADWRTTPTVRHICDVVLPKLGVDVSAAIRSAFTLSAAHHIPAGLADLVQTEFATPGDET